MDHILVVFLITAVGDYAVKNVGVIPIPEIIQYEFHPSDKFIIMASDGVWEFISSQEAVDIVQSYIHLGATFACQQLIQTAAARWQEEEGDYRDDVRIIPISSPSFTLFSLYRLPLLSSPYHCPFTNRLFSIQIQRN